MNRVAEFPEIKFTDVEGMPIVVPQGCKLPLLHHINFALAGLEGHHSCKASEVSLLQIPSTVEHPVESVMQALKFFLEETVHYPLNMCGVDFVLENVEELLLRDNLSGEIDCILFLASLFPSACVIPALNGPVVVSISRVTRDSWKVDEFGFGVERKFNPKTTAFATYRSK